jgi:hypothetical protein
MSGRDPIEYRCAGRSQTKGEVENETFSADPIHIQVHIHFSLNIVVLIMDLETFHGSVGHSENVAESVGPLP